MIRNIIFDIGNVLAAFRWEAYIQDLGYTGETAERLADATAKSPYWCEMDRGTFTLEQIIDKMVSLDPEIEKEIRHFFSDRRGLVEEYDYSESWIRELKSRGYHIYLLSNFCPAHFEYIESTFKFFGYEDGRLISYREQLLKPDRAIYEKLLNRYSLKADECVFLDDTAVNIAGAEAAGIHGILFKDYEQGRAELEVILGG